MSTPKWICSHKPFLLVEHYQPLDLGWNRVALPSIHKIQLSAVWFSDSNSFVGEKCNCWVHYWETLTPENRGASSRQLIKLQIYFPSAWGEWIEKFSLWGEHWEIQHLNNHHCLQRQKKKICSVSSSSAQFLKTFLDCHAGVGEGPQVRSLGKSHCISLLQIMLKSINYLLPLVYGYVIPTNKAGNIGPHSVVSRKEEILSPGAKCSFVWSKLPLLQCKMVGILPGKHPLGSNLLNHRWQIPSIFKLSPLVCLGVSPGEEN